MKLHVLGVDLGKTVFHLVGVDSTGKVVIRKRCSRRQLLAFTANLQVQLIGIESCSGSHFFAAANLIGKVAFQSKKSTVHSERTPERPNRGSRRLPALRRSEKNVQLLTFT